MLIRNLSSYFNRITLKSILFVLFVLLQFDGVLFAQERNCLTQVIHEHKLQSDQNYRLHYAEQQSLIHQSILSKDASAVDLYVKIPVIVHVIYNTTEQNISDEQVKSQIDILNEDYAALNSTVMDVPVAWIGLIKDSQIRFELANRDPDGNFSTGITRTYTAIQEFAIQDPAIKFDSTGGKNAWPDSAYLNIWVCKLEGNALGYATFPNTSSDQDGVVVNYQAFGRKGSLKSPYNLGRTLTHELGHWLDLAHIWGDDGGTCTSDDGIADTPKQGDSNFRCQTFPKTDNCTVNAPGIMYMNYMDYTDDKCMMFFTPGQITRMRATLNTTRTAINTSPGCIPTYTVANEVSLDSVLSPVKLVADRCFVPAVRIENNGTATVNNITIYYSVNAGLKKQFDWSGVLSSGETTIITLPYISGDFGDQIFEAWIAQNDSNKVNNYISASFKVNSAVNANCTAASSFIFPNPASGKQNIYLKTNYTESQESIVSVYSALGQKVAEKKVKINPGDVIPVSIQTLQSGVYLVQIEGGKVSEVVRFIYVADPE
ncbi:hypothetical protein BH11BAC2_BH11BAC2_07920 [soil metagenome]